jgi:hypothetical protein
LRLSHRQIATIVKLARGVLSGNDEEGLLNFSHEPRTPAKHCERPQRISCVEQTKRHMEPTEKPDHLVKRLKIFWPQQKNGKRPLQKGHLENCLKQPIQVFLCSILTSFFTSEASWHSVRDTHGNVISIGELLQRFTIMYPYGLSKHTSEHGTPCRDPCLDLIL